MLKMFLKTAHHIGEVFKQPKEQLFESPPLTSGHPKFENPPYKRVKNPTLRGNISETEQNEPQKHYVLFCVTQQTELFCISTISFFFGEVA